MRPWTTEDIPPQAGRLVVITGATGGLGYQTALALAAAGAEVVLTGRNTHKGKAAIERIRTQSPAARIRYKHLDLASLTSIASFADRFAREHPSLDLLINNAGVMAPPIRQTTSDGFELQFGTNYLGHFALTAHLLPQLRNGYEPHVVNVSSLAHRSGAIHFDDIQSLHRYRPWAAYSQSKLAMLIFTLELQRRSNAAGWGLTSNAAHPGLARTDLIANGPGYHSPLRKVAKLFWPLISQSAADSALPILYAATDPEADGGAYYGPKRAYELKGSVTEAFIALQADDTTVAKQLWEMSEQLSGVRWPTIE